MTSSRNSSARPNSTAQSPEGGPGIAAPRSVLVGAWIGIAECVLGLGYGIFLLIRDLMGYRDAGAVISGWGTALWFFLIFGAVLAGAIMLLRGSRWGRGPIIMLNLCLGGVAYYMFTSGALNLAIPTVVVAIAALACMFNPKAVDWAARSM
nr:hypothetical protein [Corynebacterium lactis]